MDRDRTRKKKGVGIVIFIQCKKRKVIKIIQNHWKLQFSKQITLMMIFFFFLENYL